jgi:hypothetical protein
MRRFVVLAVVVLAAGLGAGSVLAGGGRGGGPPGAATRGGGALENDTEGSGFECDLSGYDDHGSLSRSTYAIAYQRARNALVLTVAMRGAAQNTTYDVYIAQPGNSCGDVLGSFTTNANGKGGMTVTTPSIGTIAGIYLIGNNADYYQAPTFFNHPTAP